MTPILGLYRSTVDGDVPFISKADAVTTLTSDTIPAPVSSPLAVVLTALAR